MKRSLTFLLFVLVTFGFQQSIEAKSVTIEPKAQSTVIYDQRDGNLVPIGEIMKGQPIEATEYGSNWWSIPFANSTAYVAKDKVQFSTKTSKNPAKLANSNRVLLIATHTTINDNSSGKLVPYAKVYANLRYPVIKQEGNWWVVNAGGRQGYIHKSAGAVDQGVPVLMYHHILTPQQKADSPFAHVTTTMTTIEFNQQMDYLKKQGFTTILTKDLEQYLLKKKNLPAKAVVLTIDDGNISSRIYAYPKLKELGFKADQFIITGRTPRAQQELNHKSLQFLTETEMAQMTDVYEYHAHTHALHELTADRKGYLVTRPENQVKSDLRLNRSKLNQTPYLAYPFGQYNPSVIKWVKEVGFRMAYTTKSGYATLGTNFYEVPRKGIEPGYSMTRYAGIVNPANLALLPTAPTTPAPKPDPKPEPQPEPEPIKPVSGYYVDVLQSHDFYDAVTELTERGIVRGYGNYEFKPYNQVTRAQAAKIIAGALKIEPSATYVLPFSDIPKGNEYYRPIAALTELGIMKGDPSGKFLPGNSLTRAQMAKIITLGYELPLTTSTTFEFTDLIGMDSQTKQYIQTLFELEIVKGTSAGRYSPAAAVTRSQMALFIKRSEQAMIRINEEKEALQDAPVPTQPQAVEEIEQELPSIEVEE